MKKTSKQLYDEYRDQMNKMIAVYKYSPQKFDDLQFAEEFDAEFEKFNTLAALHADLLLQTGKKE
jgi:hypothetical protein